MESFPIWAERKIKHVEKLARQPDYLYKYTSDTIHEDEKHCNKTVTEILDICIKEMNNGKFQPMVTAFDNAEIMRDVTSDALERNIKESVLWANKLGNHKDDDRLPIHSDIMPNKIGHGITWKNNKMVYVEAKSALVILRRQPNDPNDIDFRRVTTYLNINKRKKYPDAVTLHENKNLVPYMMQTQAYKNAKTDAERQKLLSYVQRNDDSISGMGLPASKASIAEENKALNRNVQLPPELQSHYEKQQSFNDIQRKTGETPIESRHVECSLKNNPSNESQYY